MMLMHPMLERKSVPADGCIKSGQELGAPKEGPVDDMVAVVNTREASATLFE